MTDPIINKVAASGLVSLDLEAYLPQGAPVLFDLKDYLFMGMILKEKDFRESLKQVNWQEYKDQAVAITCSADAIIPLWAYMLVVTYLQPVTENFAVGDIEILQRQMFIKNINQLPIEDFRDQRVVIKGCGEAAIPAYAYAEITRILLPVVKSIMYGEPCSTVPVYKRK